MGTPGDKSRIEDLGTDETTQLEDESSDEDAAAAAHTPPEMTVLSRLPQFSTLVDYFAEPSTGVKTEPGGPPKLAQTYIDEFYAEHKQQHAHQPPPIEIKEEEETLPSLDEPGPSGLQTPKSRVPTATTTRPNVKRVKKSQSSKKPHTCQICQKTFQNTNKLLKHQQVHSNSSPFKCEHCKKSFSSKFKLVRHVLIHSDRKPFSCSVCERTFHRKDHLKNHIKVHSPLKKLYLCEKGDCKKEYTSLLSYKKHLALHAAEEGILECQICMKSFKSKEEILYHLKIHAGSRTVKNPDEKKYSCEHCTRKFFTRKDVRRHLVVHTGKRDFLCQFCPQRFGRKDHLVRHIKKSHSRPESDGGGNDGEPTIKFETDESNTEPFPAGLDLDSLLTDRFPMLDATSQQFLPHTTTQGELTDLGSEVLNEIADDDRPPEIFDGDLIGDPALINLMPAAENLPLPAFSQIFQNPPPQPPPPQ